MSLDGRVERRPRLLDPRRDVVDPRGHDDGEQHLCVGGRGRDARAQLGDSRGIGFVVGAGRVDPFVDLEQLRDTKLRGGAGVAGGERELFQLPVLQLDRAGSFFRALACELADPVVHVEVEETHEKVAALGRLVVQEARELALREHDALREMRERQAEQPLDRALHVALLAREHVGRAVGENAFEQRIAAGASLLEPDDTRRAVARVADVECQRDLGLLGAEADDPPDEPFVVVARNAAVEREAQRVDDRRLAGTGRPDQREVVDVVERQLDRSAKHAEAFELQVDRAHQRTSASASS